MESVLKISSVEFKEYLKNVVQIMEDEKDYLCELDRKLGDGGHGVTMSIGWQAVNDQLNNQLDKETDCGKISTVTGMTFLNAVGSSVGPLYASGFMDGGKEIKGKEELTDDDLVAFWGSFVKGVKKRGNAEVGDKTIMDTLTPFANELVEKFAQTKNFTESYKEAVTAGEKGMSSTKDMLAKIGRASRLGERSRSTQDPGATSAYFIIKEFEAFIII